VHIAGRGPAAPLEEETKEPFEFQLNITSESQKSFSRGDFMAFIKVFSEKCCGCRICEMACSMEHLGKFNPRRGLLRVEINRLPELQTVTSEIDLPVVCAQCEPAPCADACLEGAIGKASFGALVVDKDKCTGCGLCVDACPYKIMMIDVKGGIARKCDLCGGDPSCVKYCPMEALTFQAGGE
jgi:anaerobic carbon-monoxide dehydrogenase iron sulfur subunit